MSVRVRLVLLALATVALVAVLIVAFARQAHNEGAPGSAIVEDPAGQRFAGAARPLAPPRDFALHDQDGRLVRTQDLRGKVVVISPMYTTCRETCPLIAQEIRDALLDLDPKQRSQVTALAIAVDPPNDTPASARRFLQTRGVEDYLDFLVGEEAELRPVWRAYGFSEQLERREHNAYAVLLDRRGRQRVGFPVQHLTPEGLTHDIKLLLAERGAGPELQ